jgi:hypothetical protein
MTSTTELRSVNEKARGTGTSARDIAAAKATLSEAVSRAD